jgi:integrase
MGRNKAGQLPQMRRVTKAGNDYARVRFAGREHFLGTWGSPEAQAAYDALLLKVIEERRHGRTAPTPRTPPESSAAPPPAPEPVAVAAEVPDHPLPASITVLEVCDRYLEHCTQWYRDRDGRITSTYGNALQAVRALRVFDQTPAHLFGPKKLRAVMDDLVSEGRPRVGINRIAKAIRRLFGWAVAEELVPPAVAHGLKAVTMLSRGRTTAKELPRIKPVCDDLVDATLPYMSSVVADMVQFQRHTGARPGEVCVLRPADVDRTGSVWEYRPSRHKNEWRDDHERVVFIGPKAQAILAKYLLRPADAFCFSPKEAEEERQAMRRQARKSPRTPSQADRSPKKNPKRAPRDHYDNASYRRAITRAVAAANKALAAREEASGCRLKPLEDWAPNRLRHSKATEVRQLCGLEASQVILGHATADVTQIYAERNHALAREVALRLG